MFGSGFVSLVAFAFAGIEMGTEGMLARKLWEKMLAASRDV